MSKRVLFTVVISSGALALTACSGLTASTSNDFVGGDPSSVSDALVLKSNIDNSQELKAGQSVKFTAQEPWLIESVTVNGPSGTETYGVEAPGEKWKSEPLAPAQMSTFTATMRNPTTGEAMVVKRQVIAGPATNTFDATISPDKGSYGVGIIPEVEFDKDVKNKDRAAMVERLSVTSSPTQVAGSWRWTDSDTVAFRPDTKFWPANQKVTVTADLEGAQITEGKNKISFGEGKVTKTFKIDRAMVLTLNSDSNSGIATVNGKQVKSFPISLGKSGYTTRSGIKTITDIIRVQRMTNVGVTDDEVYDLQVPYAMRITDTGEFLHGAPWNGNIGYANTSHGCSNLTYSDAAWFFSRVKYGDPVITKNTGRPMEDWNGPGAAWNIKYSKWANTPAAQA
ncbi:MAG: L,D-transpeptidase family protein [Actinobacteria bacterium]|nr:L,D-transpeptidase family protein [Actinomycetota bacterium]